jgi:flagellar assembly protein FliH
VEEGTRSLSSIIRGAKISAEPLHLKFVMPVAPVEDLTEVQPELPEIDVEESISSAISEDHQQVSATSVDPRQALEEYRAQLEEYRAQIEKEADSMLANAKQQAEDLVAEALQNALYLRDEASKEGHASGYKVGVAQGYDEVKAFLEEAVKIVEYAKQEKQELLERSEQEILELALAVATRVVHSEITINSAVVLAVVKDALQKAKDQNRITIRVHPFDFETVMAEKQTLQAILGREMGMEIRGDIGVGAGGCVIETEYGAIDARIDTQLETIKSALLGMVKHG